MPPEQVREFTFRLNTPDAKKALKGSDAKRAFGNEGTKDEAYSST
jgi:hypothetical protein